MLIPSSDKIKPKARKVKTHIFSVDGELPTDIDKQLVRDIFGDEEAGKKRIICLANNKMLHISDKGQDLLNSIYNEAKFAAAKECVEPKYGLEAQPFSYRMLNYLQTNGLLSDNRKDGKGWRKFSLLDCFYLEIMHHLQMLEVSQSGKKQFFNFFYDTNSRNVACMEFGDDVIVSNLLPGWISLIFLLENGYEVKLVIDTTETIRFLDPIETALFLKDYRGGSFQLDLSYVWNNVKKKCGYKENEIKMNFSGVHSIDDAEKEIIKDIRELEKNGSHIFIKKCNDDSIQEKITTTISVNDQKEVMDKLSDWAKEPFADVNLINGEKGVVGVKKTQSKKLKG